MENPTTENMRKYKVNPYRTDEDPGDETQYVSISAAEDDDPGAREIRWFNTGATRNDDSDELQYEGFLSPLALKAFAEYMHEHRKQPDGSLRGPDNWQKGIPLKSYADSEWRHHMDFWLHHRGYGYLAREDMKSALCGLLFNIQGYLHEIVKDEE